MKNFKPHTLYVVFAIIALVALRIILPGIDTATGGFTFLGAVALFGGATLNNKYLSYILPAVILLVSDIAINAIHYTGNFYYTGIEVTYSAFILMAIVGRAVMQKINTTSVLLGAVSTTLVHWIYTSVFYAIGGGENVATKLPLAADANGFIIAHAQAIPFELKMLAGTFIYSALFFGIYAFGKKQATAQATLANN